MALELDGIAQGLEAGGYKKGAQLLRERTASWKEQGLIPDNLPAEKPISILEAQWQAQADRYVKLGFHRELDMSQEDYLASLPRFEPQPEAYKGRFDIPVLVETRIPAVRQAKLAGLNYYLEGHNPRDWEQDPKGYQTPQNPYTTWMQDGRINLDKSVEVVRTRLAEDERGATEWDGIALYIKSPQILKHHAIDLPGTSVGSAYAAFLSLWRVGPEVDAFRVGLALPLFGSASGGR
jgi:hypothetical protein